MTAGTGCVCQCDAGWTTAQNQDPFSAAFVYCNATSAQAAAQGNPALGPGTVAASSLAGSGGGINALTPSGWALIAGVSVGVLLFVVCCYRYGRRQGCGERSKSSISPMLHMAEPVRRLRSLSETLNGLLAIKRREQAHRASKSGKSHGRHHELERPRHKRHGRQLRHSHSGSESSASLSEDEEAPRTHGARRRRSNSAAARQGGRSTRAIGGPPSSPGFTMNPVAMHQAALSAATAAAAAAIAAASPGAPQGGAFVSHANAAFDTGSGSAFESAVAAATAMAMEMYVQQQRGGSPTPPASPVWPPFSPPKPPRSARMTREQALRSLAMQMEAAAPTEAGNGDDDLR